MAIHPIWGTLLYNFDSPMVKDFLLANAFYWLEVYHADGLRLDDVDSMLYLDFGREYGQWKPNIYGTNENLEAVEFLKHLNSILDKKLPGTLTIAQEDGLWSELTGSVEDDNIGFDYKWNNNWAGDFLAYLSKEAYKMLSAAGFDDATISASSDLDEYLIESLKAQDAKINSWGVGTRLITSDDNPAFGGVYKLAAVKNPETGEFVPKIKLSENTAKVTNPGNKTVYRIYSKSTGKIKADLICLADEKLNPDETMVVFDPVDTWKKTKILGGTYEVRELLVPVIKEGKRVYTSPSVMELRAICQKEQSTLWDESRRFSNPQKVYVDLSPKLFEVKRELIEEMSRKDLEFEEE